jgi:hypothetical protein
MTTAFHLVIPDALGGRVLLVHEGSGWILPRVISSERWAVVSPIPHEVKDRFGLDVVVLRAVILPGHDDPGEDPDDEWRFTENAGQDPPALEGWCAEEDVPGRVTDERDRAAILQWFAERRSGPPRLLEPWQREGWFAAAASWIRAAVPGVTDVEQHASWCGSMVLRIEADGGRSYLKAAPRYFLDEPGLTAMLADRFPQTIPRPIAIDVERGWMVLRDFGDTLVGPASIEHWEGALDAMVSIQRTSVPIVGDLLRGGCRDRRLTVLASQIEALADGRLGSIPDGYPERLRATVPRFAELRAELEAAPIPDTLVHGDFHPDNVAIQDGRYLVFDWTDACVAHPFVDLLTYVHTLGPPTTDVAVRMRLTERYLEGWNDVIPREEATELFRRTEPLLAMHHVISYQRILERLDPTERWQWESHLPWWLDRALDAAM